MCELENLLLERVLSQFTADTRLLVSAEWNSVVKRVGTVDLQQSQVSKPDSKPNRQLKKAHPNSPSANLMSHIQRALNIAREHSSSEAVRGVVRLAYDVRVVLELDDDADGPEDLLAHDLHVRLDVREDRRLDEEALAAVAVAAEVHFRTVLLAGVDVGHDALYYLYIYVRNGRG